MIKIREEDEEDNKTAPVRKIHVTLENNEEKIFDNYPIIIKSKDLKHLTYEILKSTKTKANTTEKGKTVDKVKEKTKDVKDKVLDTTKDIADKTKHTLNQSSSSSTTQSTYEGIDEQPTPDPEAGQFDDPLISRK